MLELNRSESGFSLSYEGKTLFSHSLDEPMVYLGLGDETIDMHHGNFHIADEVTERIPFNAFTATQDESSVVIRLYKDYHASAFTLTLREEAGRLIVTGECDCPRFNRLWLRLYAEPGEHVYGLGEQYSALDLRGRNYPIFTMEQGVGRNKSTLTTFLADQLDGGGGDYWTTYYPEATYVSSRRYFLHLHGYGYAEVDFSHENYHALHLWQTSLAFTVSAKQRYTDLLSDLTALVGRQPPLPDYMFSGILLGMQGGSEVCRNKLERMLAADTAVSAVWTQDWVGKRVTSFGKRLQWDWRWNEALYPTLREDIATNDARGIAWMGYINPYLVEGGALFTEAKDRGYFVKKQDGTDYLVDFGEFDCGFVDLTNPDACIWYKGVIKENMIALGLRGWMVDFGEYLPTDSVLFSGQDAISAHNEWPTLWAKLNYEALEESGKRGKIGYYTRSGATGTQRYSPLMFSGDQFVDFSPDDGLPSVINAALSLGMTGFGMLTFDIGGYTALFGKYRTKELLLRGCEFAAFTPVMRTHEGNRPDENTQFDADDETVAFFSRFSRIHRALSPYLTALGAENCTRGLPAMRALFLHYPDDERAHTAPYEYLLGRDILVTPVVVEGAESRSLYLPQDRWVHLWSGAEYAGGEITVSASIGQPPVFYRAESEIAGVMASLREIR